MSDSWPEQDAIIQWLYEMEISVHNNDLIQLAEAVSAERLRLQRILENIKSMIAEQEQE